MRLAGSVALVTGAGRGIGRAAAVALGAEGAAVGLTARSAHELAEVTATLRAQGVQTHAAVADIAEPVAVADAVAQIEDALGPVDVLVNNAGTSSAVGPPHSHDADEWWRTLEVNLRGPMLASRLVAAGMVRHGRGRIICTASVAALKPVPVFSAYSVSKTALVRFVEQLAVELGGFGVTAFALNPGPVKTALNQGVADSPLGRELYPGFADYIAANGREPEQIAPLIVRMACGDLDALSGRLIAITDDVDALVAEAPRIVDEELYTLRMSTLTGAAKAVRHDNRGDAHA